MTDPTTGLVYEIEDSSGAYGAGAYVTGYTGTDSEVNIPKTLGEQPVVSVVLSGNTSIKRLNAYGGSSSKHLPLANLDMSGCTNLNGLTCNDCSLTNLNISGDNNLMTLSCEYDSLTTLSLDGCTALTAIYCDHNGLTALDVSACAGSLVTLNCSQNQLASLDVSYCVSLHNLNCADNYIFDTSALQALTGMNSLQVTPQSFAPAQVSVAQTSRTYTGSPLAPTLTVTYVAGGTTHTMATTDYSVFYKKEGDTSWSSQAPTAVGTYTVMVTGDGSTFDESGSHAKTVTFTIAQAASIITVRPTASDITYGQTLASSTLSGGVASVGTTTVPGTFSWTDSTIKPSVSDSNTTAYSVTFTPTDPGYSTVTTTVTVPVTSAQSVIAFPTPAVSSKSSTSIAMNAAIVSAGDGPVTYAIAKTNIAPIGATAWQPSPIFTGLDPATTYYVFARVSGTANYKPATTAGLEVATKAVGTVTTPTLPAVTYDPDATLADISLPTVSNGTWAWADATQVPAMGTAGYTAIFAPSDADTVDYSGVEGYDATTGKVTRTVSLTVNAADVSSSATVAIPDQTFTGAALTPAPTITWNGHTLVSGTDYDVTYASNTAVGTATATITFKGNYTGTVTAYFHIVSASAPTSATSSPAATTALPKTGDTWGVLALGFIAMMVIGAASIVVVRRRKA